MDLRKILTCYFQVLCVILLNWQSTTGQSRKNTGHPTKVTQITFPITGQTSLLRSQQQKTKKKKRASKGKNPRLIKEFPLQHLMNIGLTSNEANSFIHGHHLKGKPLEVQYERTREDDMNGVERRLFMTQAELKLLIKRSQRKKKNEKASGVGVQQMKRRRIARTKRKHLTKKDLMRRQLGFI